MTQAKREKISVVLLVTISIATLFVLFICGGCNKTPGLGGADQSDPQKLAQYVAKEIFEKTNFQILETYASFDLKKKLDNEKKMIEDAKKGGWPLGKGTIAQYQDAYESFQNKWGKTKSYGVWKIKEKESSGPNEKTVVALYDVREHSKLDPNKRHACDKGDTDEQCLRAQFANVVLTLIKEHNGKWYIEDYYFSNGGAWLFFPRGG